MKFLIIIIFTISLSFIACKNDPEPINFGTDECAHCKMTIMDKRFGAEIVTTKGKIYKFDAAECMINFTGQGKINAGDVEQYLVIDFSQPEKLVNAESSTFLISQNLPSPMGANLSSYADRKSAEKNKSIYNGELYDWTGAKEKVRR